MGDVKLRVNFTKEYYHHQMQSICNYIKKYRMPPPGLEEWIVDNFAGGGGASTGMEMATGYSVNMAINHDMKAIRMHEMNHPHTKHFL